MSFTPVVPFSGYSGWAFLKRTQSVQQASFNNSSQVKRDEAYFRENIGKIKTADALVKDHRLLSVALGAFGLDADINSKFFVRKVLEDGTLTPGALANKLSNKQYHAFSKAFGFGDYNTPRTQLSEFADQILSRYKSQQFEVAVGEVNNAMRLSLNADRELQSLAESKSSTDTKWFTIMGNPPLRTVFQTALGLPASFATIDLDQQLVTLKDKMEKVMGDSGFEQFADPANREKFIRTFLVRDEIGNGVTSSFTKGYGALMLLQAGQ